MIWNLSANYAERRVNAEASASQYSHDTAERIERACGRTQGAALSECMAEQIKASRENERAEQDLRAQQDMADWAFWLLLISTATLGTAAAALYFVRETLLETQLMAREARRGTRVAMLGARAAQAGVKETQRIGEAQVRAYLTGISAEIGFTGEGLAILNCTVKNAGQSPARAVRCTGKIYYSAMDGYEYFEHQFEPFKGFEADIGAGAEETVSFNVKAGMDAWAAASGGLFFIGADVRISGKDVFGLPFGEEEKFSGHPTERPEVNTWIPLKRAARVATDP